MKLILKMTAFFSCIRRIFRFAAIPIICLFFVCICISSCSVQAKQQPDIILLSIDTLRGDHFTPEYMPKTYAWARQNAVIYTNARSTATWTLPSHISILTGLLPSQHGCRHMYNEISPDLPFVQYEFSNRGYKTYAYTGGYVLDAEHGFDKTFDFFSEANFIPFADQSATFKDRIADTWLPVEAAQHIIQADVSYPRFFFVQTYFVHEWCLWASDPNSVPQVGRRQYVGTLMKSPAAFRKNCYESAVKEMDTRLAQFLKIVTGKNCVVIITSDHGEAFGDIHGGGTVDGHGKVPYSSQINVPLIVYRRELHPGIISELFSQKHLASIIRALADGENLPHFPEIALAEHTSILQESGKFYTALAIPGIKYINFPGGRIACFSDQNDRINTLATRRTAKMFQPSDELAKSITALGYIQ